MEGHLRTRLISEHTIACLPKSSGMILDVGCRSFDFSRIMLKEGYKVVSIEADDRVIVIEHENLRFGNYALVPESKNGSIQTLVKFGNGSANHLLGIAGEIPENKRLSQVLGLSITETGRLFEVPFWDIVKLDCEGAEYDVLMEWPGPIARQITVEFHEHTGANVRGKYIYNDILSHLSEWYRVIQHELSVMHNCSVPNYWDSLFVLKEMEGDA